MPLTLSQPGGGRSRHPRRFQVERLVNAGEGGEAEGVILLFRMAGMTVNIYGDVDSEKRAVQLAGNSPTSFG